MRADQLIGKTIQSITYNYGMYIVFTDGTALSIDSRYEGGLECFTEIVKEIKEKRRVVEYIDRD